MREAPTVQPTTPVARVPVHATMLAGSTSAALRVALFAGWLVIVAYLAWHHVFWRDEVRAFSLALSGSGLAAMARAVHGEGHPLLWYLLLRLAHDVMPMREVLPAMGLAIGIAGGGLFAWRAPLRPAAVAAVLFGGWMTFEYTVMARNYGISMLLMFVLADRAARRRDGMWSTGGLLFLLCNTNVPSVIVAGGFLLFRLAEIVAAEGWRWTPALGRWLGTVAWWTAGAVVCFLTVYPPFNDAAVSPLASQLSPRAVWAAATGIGGGMTYLWPQPAWPMPGSNALLTLLIVAAPLSLLRAPAAAIAAAAVLPLMLLFFQLVYPGSYRHQALYLCFVVALHWMVASGCGGQWEGASALSDRLRSVASAAFVLLLLVQIVPTASLLAQTAQGRVPGQSEATARLLSRPDLRRAIVVGVPEVMVEPLPYYAANPIWLLREHRWGAVAHFTRQADLHLTLGGVLAAARRLQAVSGRPVVILMQHRIVRGGGGQRWEEGYLAELTASPAEAAAFLDATDRLARPVPLIRYAAFDESYDVYVLKAHVTGF